MKFRLIDPKEIIAVIVILIVLGVGVYAFFMATGTLRNTGFVTTPVGNNGVVATKTIQGWTGAPTGNYLVFVPLGSGYTNTTGQVGVIRFEAYNVTQGAYVRVYCENGTFVSGNSTYRVSRRTVNGSTAWTSFKLTYNIPGTATSTLVNQSFKTLKNESTVGSTVFNVLGVIITISAILSIISVIYVYMRPK